MSVFFSFAIFFFVKQKTAYEMRISDWSSDVCSSDLIGTLASIHDLNLAAAFCDRLYVIDHGHIVASGTPKEVLTATLLRDVFGVQALIDEHPLAAHPRITWITQS